MSSRKPSLLKFLTFILGVFVILGNTYDPVTRTWDVNGVDLVRQQDFWFTVGMTVLYVPPGFLRIYSIAEFGASVALPWFFVREVPVDIELVSTPGSLVLSGQYHQL